MKSLISIGYQIPGHSDLYKSFSTPISLLDFDIVVFSPEFSYEYHEYHEGKPRYSDSSSFEVREHSAHWAREITYCLGSGKTVFILLSKKDAFHIYSGRSDFAGTGKNTRQINYVEPYHNYKFLSFVSLKIEPTDGKVIENPRNPIFNDFYFEFKDYLTYQNYIEVENSDPLFITKTGNKVIGAIRKYTSGGHLVFLPYIEYDFDSFTGKNKKGESVWKKEAIVWGTKLFDSFIRIDKSLSSENERTPEPKWVSSNNFILESEKLILSRIFSVENDISRLNIQLDSDRKELLQIRELKYLLFETGKNLERAVEKALHILGYKAEGYDNGKLEIDHVIISPEGYRYIGECEGKDSKSVDISKFRQLADEINEDYERDEVESEAYGLLFGNPQRLLPIEERSVDFTQKCIDGAKRKGFGLVRTADLFPVCKYILESNDESFMLLCRKAIHESLGNIIKFPEIPNRA